MPSLEALSAIPRIEGTQPLPLTPSGASRNSESRAGWVDNLLPLANASLFRPSEGVYLGEGIPLAPAKLAARIRRGEFVEMGELLPEFWSGATDEDAGPSREPRGRRSRKVTDIFTWLQCYGAYVSTRATTAPHLTWPT